jgi:uncharacterized coiled-coil protein SlyX
MSQKRALENATRAMRQQVDELRGEGARMTARIADLTCENSRQSVALSDLSSEVDLLRCLLEKCRDERDAAVNDLRALRSHLSSIGSIPVTDGL